MGRDGTSLTKHFTFSRVYDSSAEPKGPAFTMTCPVSNVVVVAATRPLSPPSPIQPERIRPMGHTSLTKHFTFSRVYDSSAEPKGPAFTMPQKDQSSLYDLSNVVVCSSLFTIFLSNESRHSLICERGRIVAVFD